MASTVITDEMHAKEQCEKILGLVSQYYDELTKAQDPTELAEKIEQHAVSPASYFETQVNNPAQTQLVGIRAHWEDGADTYTSIDRIVEKTRAVVDAFSQAKDDGANGEHDPACVGHTVEAAPLTNATPASQATGGLIA